MNSIDYILNQAKALLSIDSPTGYTREVTDYLLDEFAALGYTANRTVKGGVMVDLGGRTPQNALLLEAHVDTLGGMVKEIKSNGNLRIAPLGGLNPNNVETEICRIITRFNGIYEGTFQLDNASTHVNLSYDDTKRTFDTIEIVLDEDVASKADTEALGISIGDFVAVEPRTVITKTGYIKSRFLDDKLSTAILLGFARHLKQNQIVPDRHIYLHITVFEEVGHGGRASIPADVTEVISVDMGCVGDHLDCTERQVSICAKDSRGPYHYDVVSGLVKAAKDANIDYAIDLYPAYGSDADAALFSGHDVRHGLIGPGVYASHGYERSHVDGVKNTFELLKSYLL